MIKSAYLAEMINFYDQIFIIWRQLGGHFGLLDGANGDRSLADLIKSADSGPLSMELIPGLPGLVFLLAIFFRPFFFKYFF